MTEAFNLATLTRYKALQYARASYRAAGRKPPKMAQQRIDAEALSQSSRSGGMGTAGCTSDVDPQREFVSISPVQLETQMSIKVGASVTWRHGKSKPGRKETQAPRVANCTVIELGAAEDGRARIRLPPIFGNQQIMVLIADLEDAG